MDFFIDLINFLCQYFVLFDTKLLCCNTYQPFLSIWQHWLWKCSFLLWKSSTIQEQQVLPHHSQEMLQFQQRTQMLWKFLWNAPVVVAGKQDELQQQQFDKTFSWFHNKNQQKSIFIFFSNPIYKNTFEFDRKSQQFRPPHKNINNIFLVKMPFSLDFDNRRGHSYSNSFQKFSVTPSKTRKRQWDFTNLLWKNQRNNFSAFFSFHASTILSFDRTTTKSTISCQRTKSTISCQKWSFDNLSIIFSCQNCIFLSLSCGWYFFLVKSTKNCFLTNKSCDNNFILFDKKLLCIIIVSHSLYVDPKQNSLINYGISFIVYWKGEFTSCTIWEHLPVYWFIT